tara:strand:+ start:864 stop:1592 length:729 start_codon:yes stop_codon:yes gene_type:complete
MKKVFITGSSKGIGYDIARKFVDSKKYFVYLNSRSKNVNINKIIKCRNTTYFKCDVEKIADVKKLAKNFNKRSLDTIICNVGGGRYNQKGFENIKDYQKSLSINFFSAINIIYNLKDKLKKNSKIICISSIASKNICNAPLAYVVAKSALNSFIVGFAKNFKFNKTSITGILPGHTMHNNSVWRLKLKNNPKLIKKMKRENMPTGEFVESVEIAELTFFVSELKGNSLNGSLIEAEGGINTR